MERRTALGVRRPAGDIVPQGTVDGIGALTHICGAAVDAIQRYYRIDRNGIALLKFILESYDNAAVMRTVDEKGSIVELFVSPGFLDDVEAVIAEFRDEFNIQEVERPDYLPPL
jgi:hypothetical protein